MPLLRAGAAHYLIDDSLMDVDVEALLRGWLGMAKRSGGRLLTRAGLESGERRGGVWRLTTRAGACEAAVLVNAAGPWADELARRCGVSPLGLVPKRRSMCIVPPPATVNFAAWPQIVALNDTFYAKPSGGKQVICPADATACEPHDAYADDMALAEGIAAYCEAVDHEVVRIERSWGGLRTFATDGNPVVGFDPSADGFFWSAGLGGYGIQTSPALSALAADLVLAKGASPDLASALSPLRLARAGSLQTSNRHGP